MDKEFLENNKTIIELLKIKYEQKYKCIFIVIINTLKFALLHFSQIALKVCNGCPQLLAHVLSRSGNEQFAHGHQFLHHGLSNSELFFVFACLLTLLHGSLPTC